MPLVISRADNDNTMALIDPEGAAAVGKCWVFKLTYPVIGRT